MSNALSRPGAHSPVVVIMVLLLGLAAWIAPIELITALLIEEEGETP